MKTRAWGQVQGLSAFILLAAVQVCSQTRAHSAGAAGVEFRPALKLRRPPTEMRRQQVCADQVVARLAHRDRLDRYALSQEVQLEPRNRREESFVNICELRTVTSPKAFVAAFPCKAGVTKLFQQVLGNQLGGRLSGKEKGKEMLRSTVLVPYG